MRRAPFLVAAVSLAWGLVVSVGAYAVLRVVQSCVYPDPDPRGVVWSAHAGYFWRVWTVLYAGGIAAFVAVLLVGRSVEAWARGLVPAASVAVTLLALQACFFP